MQTTPADLPTGGTDMERMRRIFMLRRAHGIAALIWSWGCGFTTTKSLRVTVNYYGEFRCSSPETVEQIQAIFAAFAPADLDGVHHHDELRPAMKAAGDWIKEQIRRIEQRAAERDTYDIAAE